ncbi:MAG TPA: ISL3 family transposase, partial [Methanocorpusculum sp.]|nr:ISL3 family transposase [Methanocorpusculum sp.]
EDKVQFFRIVLMEGMILLLAKQMTVSALGKYIDETDKRVFRVLRYYVKRAHEKQDCSVITSICVDETASKKGHNYITVFSDVDTGKVVYVTPGKDASTIADFRDFLLTHNGNPNQIHSVCCDMSPAFIGGVENTFPDASIVFDKFHLMLAVNKTVNDIRIEERKTTDALKKTKYLFLKNPENLTEKERKKLDSIVCQNLKTAKAYHIRLNFQELWKCKTPSAAEKFLKQWYFWITHSKIPQMKELAKTIKRHWKGIINYFFAHVTNGILEGINGMIQNIKREARGYKNIGNFITMIYLRLGELELEVPMLKA